LNSIQGRWEQVDVAGHACDVYEPPERNPHGYVAIYLHGIHSTPLRENIVFNREFAQYSLSVIAPVTRRSWWTDKICAEFDPQVTAERHLIDRVLPYIAERFGSAPPRIALFGTSMGGQGALRFAFKHPNRFPICAGIAPAIDYQLRFYEDGEETLPLMYPDAEAARQDTATLHVHPLNWPRNIFFASDPEDHRWHDSAQKLRMKLAALGIPHECDLETSGGGHSWEYYNLIAPRAIRFLFERLEHERRRVT
jgi:enterochelin esterase-like enzyme